MWVIVMRARGATGTVVPRGNRAELPVQLPQIATWLGTDEGELVSAGAEARYAFASVLARAAKSATHPCGSDDPTSSPA